MVKEGVMDKPKVDAIFGLHAWPGLLGTARYRSGPMMAAAERMRITVKGKQTHGAVPWGGVDPIVAASQIIMGLQTIHSRQIDTREPVVISIGSIHGGVRHNIIPELVELVGTIRTHDPQIRQDVKQRIERLVTHVAASTGAVASVSYGVGVPANINSAPLVESMLPTLRAIVGKDFVHQQSPVMGYEDMSYFQERVPGMFVFLGARPPGLSLDEAPSNHSPYFDIDEAALRTGVRILAGLSLEFLKKAAKK